MIISTKLSIGAALVAFAGITASGALHNGQYNEHQQKIQKQEQTMHVQAKKDRQLINRLQNELSQKGLTKGSEINIKVYKRVAYLSGFANNDKDRIQAIEAAEQTPGLIGVNATQLRHIVDMPAIVVHPQREVAKGKLVAAR